MALKPSTRLAANSLKEMTLLGIYSRNTNTMVKKEPKTREREESQSANAPAMDLPSRMPPV